MEHARRGKDDHRSRIVDVASVKRLDVAKVEHVAVHEGFADFLVGPGDEHLVVVVRLLRHPGAEVDGALQVHPLPVGFWPPDRRSRLFLTHNFTKNFIVLKWQRHAFFATKVNSFRTILISLWIQLTSES